MFDTEFVDNRSRRLNFLENLNSFLHKTRLFNSQSFLCPKVKIEQRRNVVKPTRKHCGKIDLQDIFFSSADLLFVSNARRSNQTNERQSMVSHLVRSSDARRNLQRSSEQGSYKRADS